MGCIKPQEPPGKQIADSPGNRIRVLDGLRGIAVIAVVYYHYFVVPVSGIVPKSLFAYIQKVGALAWSGVDLFFVLSGFLIVGILVDNKGADNYFRTFYLRRAFRILPLYVALLILWVLFVHGGLLALFHPDLAAKIHERPKSLIPYFTFTQNIVMGLDGDFGLSALSPTWSLAVEEQFYLIMPLVVFLVPRSCLAGILVLVFLAGPVIRCFVPAHLAHLNLPTHADGLVVGALIALAVRHKHVYLWLSNHRGYCSAALGLAILGIFALIRRDEIMGAFQLAWIAWFYGMVTLWLLLHPETAFAGLMRNGVLVFFGKISYCLYLFHGAIQTLVYGRLTGGFAEVNTPRGRWCALLALGLSILVSAVSYHTFERFFMSLGSRYRYRFASNSERSPAGSALVCR